MDKKAVMYAVGAMIIILIVALVIKPIATGQPLNLGLPGATTPLPTYPVTTPDKSGVTHVVIPATSGTTPPDTGSHMGQKRYEDSICKSILLWYFVEPVTSEWHTN